MGDTRTGMAVILFSDQVGSTATRAALGEDSADALRRQHDTLVEQAVVANDGRIVKWLGDGMAAAFDSASAAIGAAVDIQRRIAEHNRRRSSVAPLAVRIGISAGDVTWELDDFHGIPVVEAAAAPDTILCSDIVRALAGSRVDVELRPVGTLELKGLAAPLAACEIDWRPSDQTSRTPLPEALARNDRLSLVGRAREQARLTELWRRAVDGELVVALVGGEPGAGKTRLVREAAKDAHRQGAMVLYGRCDEDLGVPYQPFAEALRFFLDKNPNPQAHLGRMPSELARLVPELSIDDPASSSSGSPETRHRPVTDPETERYHLFEALLSWLEAAAEEPVVLVLDDLHWATRETMLLLRHVMRAQSTAPIMILATYRDVESERSPELADLLAGASRESNVMFVELGGLEADDIGRLLVDFDIVSGSPDLAATIQDQTGGNAYFIGELMMQLAERAESRDDADEAVEVPRTVQEVVMGRVDRLPTATRETLEMAAAGGSEIEVDVLARALDLTVTDVVDTLGPACRARLSRELPEPPLRYRFQHAIVRTALYQHTPVHRRGRHHHDLGIAIEDRHADRITEHLDDLAFHFARSSDEADIAKLIRYAREAGDRAMDQVAYDKAAGFYQLALQAIERPGSTADPHLHVATLVELGRAQRRGHLPDGRATLLRAADMAAALGDRDLLIAAALANTRTVFWTGEPTDPERSLVFERALHQLDPGDSAERAQLTACLSVERYLASDEVGHVRLADEALAISRRMHDATTLGFVLHYRNLTMWRPDTVAERLALAREMRDLAEGRGSENRFELGTWAFPGFNAAIEAGDLAFADHSLAEVVGLALEARYVNHTYNTRLVQSTRAAIAGRLDESMRLADEMLVLGQAASQAAAPVFHLGLRHNVYLHQGRLDETVDALAWAAEHYPNIPTFRFGLALALAESDRTDEAMAVLEPFLATGLAAVPFDRDWLTSVCSAARVAWDAGDRRAAQILRPLLEPYAGQCTNNGTVWLGRVEGFVALLDDVLGDRQAAEAHFATAAEAHRSLPAPVALAWTLVDWGEASLRHASAAGDPGAIAAAESHLREGRDLAARLGLGRLHRRATAALRAADSGHEIALDPGRSQE
ncbi:MAG: ATP-binding protein [Acidimicrobiales bacterium]